MKLITINRLTISVFLSFYIQLCQANDLIIKNVTVINPIDSNTVVTLKHQWLMIKDGRISQISDRKITPNKQTKVLDGRGKFLIPGLMDSHVHTGSMPGMRDDFPKLGYCNRPI